MNFRRFAMLSVASLAISASASSVSALSITPTGDASALAGTLFLNSPDLTIQGVDLSGNFDVFGGPSQAGIYSNTSSTFGLPSQGIVLSTGDVNDYTNGPNEFEDNSTDYTLGFEGGGELEEIGGTATFEQNDLLSPITGQNDHFDVVQLDINFFSSTDQATFFATFGSEEFPEFQDSSFIDGFGLFVNGTNVAGVNGLPVNINHPNFGEFPGTPATPGTELDGVLFSDQGSPVLRFDVPLNAGEVNEFTIILADASDPILDTTVYLSSFFADPTLIAAGSSEFNPLLPDNPPDPVTGTFVIELNPEDFEEGQTIWLDPPVSVGFTYEVEGGALFTEVTAPSFATVEDLDGYTITDGISSFDLAPGGTIDLVALFGAGLTSFTLEGIDPDLMLDPLNALAFPLGVVFDDLSLVGQVNITPVTDDTTVGGTPAVPLPAAGFLYLGLAGAGAAFARRRRKA